MRHLAALAALAALPLAAQAGSSVMEPARPTIACQTEADVQAFERARSTSDNHAALRLQDEGRCEMLSPTARIRLADPAAPISAASVEWRGETWQAYLMPEELVPAIPMQTLVAGEMVLLCQEPAPVAHSYERFQQGDLLTLQGYVQRGACELLPRGVLITPGPHIFGYPVLEAEVRGAGPVRVGYLHEMTQIAD